MKALTYRNKQGDFQSIKESKGAETYELLRLRLPEGATDIQETEWKNIILPSESAEVIENRRLEKLKIEALAYQSSQQSQNELGLLHGYSTDDLATRPKAQAQINWMTSLFALHNEKKADATNDTPFSSVGDKPHSFDELYNEKFS